MRAFNQSRPEINIYIHPNFYLQYKFWPRTGTSQNYGFHSCRKCGYKIFHLARQQRSTWLTIEARKSLPNSPDMNIKIMYLTFLAWDHAQAFYSDSACTIHPSNWQRKIICLLRIPSPVLCSADNKFHPQESGNIVPRLPFYTLWPIKCDCRIAQKMVLRNISPLTSPDDTNFHHQRQVCCNIKISSGSPIS